MPKGERSTFQGMVIRFGASAGKNNFTGRSTNQGSNLRTGKFYSFPGIYPKLIPARRVAKIGVQVRPHGSFNLRVNWGGGIIIEVNWVLHGGCLILKVNCIHEFF